MILNVFCKKHPKYKAIHEPRRSAKGDSCQACWILFFLSDNSALGKREVGVQQKGLACKPPGILIARKAE
jgi:hypothetical protein